MAFGDIQMGYVLIVLWVALITTIVAHLAWFYGGRESQTLNVIARGSLIVTGAIVLLIAISRHT